MQIEISQSFSFFSILYLFYNVDLLKMCNKFEMNTRFFKYVDDVNILIYEKNIDENCRNFEKCINSANDERFDMNSCSFWSSTSWFISSKIQKSSTWRSRSRSIRTRFNRKSTYEFLTCKSTHDWNEIHTCKKFKKKMTKKIMILTQLSIFDWKAIFRKIRMLYIFVIRSIFTYDVFVWHMLKNKKSKIINKFVVIQNRCLRNIFESFRIISISILKAETHVVFIDLHLNQLQIQIKYRMQIANMSNIIRKKCKSITNKLNNDFEKSRMHKFISSELKHEWVTQQLIDKQTFSIIIRFAFWTNSARFDQDAIRFNN
jgi:hypothetical protein